MNTLENIRRDLLLPLRHFDRDRILLYLRDVENALQGEVLRSENLLSEGFSLIDEAASSNDMERMGEIHSLLNENAMGHFLLTSSVRDLHSFCTHYRDILARRVLEIAEAEAGTPPLPYALISMGSDGRKEQTLITDQDYLIIYGDGGGEAEDAYFERFSSFVVESLAKIGFKKCTGDIMPTNPTWRGSFSQWKRRLTAIVRYEYTDYAKNLMDLIVLSDARFVGGDQRLADQLIRTIRGLEQDYFQVLWGMAKAAAEMKIALGFLKRFWTEGSGDHRGEFNIKLLGWAPLVMNIRILAINQALPATGTVERIDLLVKEGSLSAETGNGLRDAYFTLTKHRILLQIRVIKGILNDSYYLNPYQLPTEERETLRQALLKIEELQKMIHINFSIM